MNYAVYIHRVVDGHAQNHIVAYKMTSDGINGFHLMTQAEAQAYADAIEDRSGITVMVLPLEPDQEITAF